jgi:hypothetical protein
MRLHLEMPMVVLLCLMHLGIARLVDILGGRRRSDDRCIDDRTLCNLRSLGCEPSVLSSTMVNLTDLDRGPSMVPAAPEAMSVGPKNADVKHSFGLYGAATRYSGALDLLLQASELAPENARYAYVYACRAELDRRPKRSNGYWSGRISGIRPAVRY